MMKLMRFKWKYLLASLLLANIIACSNDDLAQMSNRLEQDSGARTAELFTKTVTLETAGTLEAKLSEAMGETDVTTLEKLVVSGPFTAADMRYVRDRLTGLVAIDMKNVLIKASDEAYSYSTWNSSYFHDDQLVSGMFYDMDNLKEVVLPSTITSIGSNAFYACDNLVSVTIPETVTKIDESAFYNCPVLASVNLPENLDTIGAYAFSYCDSLKAIHIPGGVKEIDYSCFYDCLSLEEITFSEGLEFIDDQSFRQCRNVKEIKLPSTLKSIGNGAFELCNSLQELIVPENVIYVGSNFVSGCSNLKTLVWNPTLDVPYCYAVQAILFVNTDQIGVENVSEWKTVVIDGIAESTVDLSPATLNGDYANLREFKANKLTYSKSFWDETLPGGSSGWQTIVLPFTPDSIYHETKGQIAPFNSNIEGAKPFWLRELTPEGFKDVTKIEANKAYIIAMPNHSDYLDEYRLNGTITFVARDSVLRVTPDALDASIGPDYELHPTYQYIEQSEDIYTLGTIWDYYEEENIHYDKSFFKKNDNSVSAFNAYVTTLGGGRSSRSVFDLNTRSKETRAAWQPNTTGIPQIGDM